MKTRPELAVEEVDGEIIVLDKAAGRVHQLNPSASFVWRGVGDGLAIEEIGIMLSEAFDVDQAQAESDARATLAQLEDLGLVVE